MVQQYTLNQILKLFDLTKDTDHDLRFMALNDLNKIVIESPQQFSTYNRTTLVYANILISSLNDQHSEVQNQAVKCFVLLTPLLKPDDVLKFINQLMIPHENDSSLIVSSVFTMAVKTILENLNLTNYQDATMILNQLLPNVLNYSLLISKIDVIEILNDIIENLGIFLSTDQINKIYELLIKVEFNAESTISKASITGLGKLLKFIDERQLSNILNLTNQEFQNNLPKHTDDTYYHLFTLRLSILTIFFKEGTTNVNSILPNVLDIVFQNLFIEKLSKPIDEDEFDEIFKIDQVRDDSLLCLETIVQKIPYEIISPYMTHILTIASQFLSYDPFTQDSKQSDDEDDFEISDNEEFDYEPEDEEENDYDLSWSIRKNSLKLIGKIVDNYPLLLRQIYKLKLFNVLIDKLSDNSTNASNEVINTLTKIISSTSKTGTYFTMTFYDAVSNNIKKRRSEDGNENDKDIVMDDLELDPFDSLNNNSELLCSHILDILINDKNIYRFNVIFNLLSQLTSVLNGLPGDYLYQIIKRCNDLHLIISINLLKFYSDLLKTNDLLKFNDQTPLILDSIIMTSNETNNYELSLEGLIIASELFKSITPLSQQFLGHDQILKLSNILSLRANSKNYSNEIKEKCLYSLTELIVNYDQFHKEELSSLLQVYDQSLEYESLIEASVSGLAKIIPLINEKFNIDILQEILTKFVSLLNLKNADLKNVILECLVIVTKTSIPLSPQVMSDIVSLCYSLLQNDSLSGKQIAECLLIIGNFSSNCQLQVNDLINIITIIIPNISKIDQDAIFEFILKLSPTLNEPNLFQIISTKFSQVNSKEFRFVFPGMLASIALALNMANVIKDSEDFITSNTALSPELEFHVLFLGFIGQKIPLHIDLEKFMQILDLPDDTNLKTATLSAIGNIATFDVTKYLPILLPKLTTNDLLTLSLRKILEVKINGGQLYPIAHNIADDDYKTIWNLLLDITTDKPILKTSQGELNVIADCLTLIAILDVTKIDDLINYIDSTTSISSKYTIVSTIKYFLNYVSLFSHNPIIFDKYLSKLLEKSSLLIFNDNLQLKQASVQALITSLHNKPLLTLPILVQLLSTIMEKELLIRKDYIDTIQIGPFKHKIDNALDLRKSIYEMVYTLMTTIENNNIFQTNTIKQNLNYHDILKISIERGLKDDNDVIQLSSLIISKIINLKPLLFFNDLELLKAFTDRSTKIINKKSKENDTKQVMEKQKESIKCIQNLITNLDQSFKKNGLQNVDFEDWRKFVFINGVNNI